MEHRFPYMTPLFSIVPYAWVERWFAEETWINIAQLEEQGLLDMPNARGHSVDFCVYHYEHGNFASGMYSRNHYEMVSLVHWEVKRLRSSDNTQSVLKLPGLKQKTQPAQETINNRISMERFADIVRSCVLKNPELSLDEQERR